MDGNKAVSASAIGAQVRIKLAKGQLVRNVDSSTGQGNQNDPTLHFGLGESDAPVTLDVRWPDGTRQQLQSEVDRTVIVKHPGKQ